MEGLNFIKGQRNTKICVPKNYVYNFERIKKDDSLSYRFRRRYFPGRLLLQKDAQKIYLRNEHIHETEEKYLMDRKLKDTIYMKAIDYHKNFDDVLFYAIAKTDINNKRPINNLRIYRNYFNTLWRN